MGERLTPEGLAWAVQQASGSLVARVALGGEGWPQAHQDAAVLICNRLAKGEPAGGVVIPLEVRRGGG